jgi:hypothetical protein
LVSLGRLMTIRGCCGERYGFSYLLFLWAGLLTGFSSRGIFTTNGDDVRLRCRYK